MNRICFLVPKNKKDGCGLPPWAIRKSKIFWLRLVSLVTDPSWPNAKTNPSSYALMVFGFQTYSNEFETPKIKKSHSLNVNRICFLVPQNKKSGSRLPPWAIRKSKIFWLRLASLVTDPFWPNAKTNPSSYALMVF